MIVHLYGDMSFSFRFDEHSIAYMEIKLEAFGYVVVVFRTNSLDVLLKANNYYCLHKEFRYHSHLITPIWTLFH